MHRRLLLLATLCACGGGGSEGDLDAGPDAGADVDAGGDPSEDVFDPAHLVRVDIDLDPADWDALRLQTRSIFDVLGQSCLAAAPESPFSYFHATVRIDGRQLSNVGVRKKGFFGSLSTTKPSLKVNFDEFVPDQEYAGLDKLTLNNAISDPSLVKQCIGYQLFADAGIPSPRCNFARVRVNGEEMGVYVNVESVDKKFLKRHFADNDSNLYEGALSDFRPGWVETFDKKTNESNPDRSDLQALVDALEVPDDELLDALAPLVDVDRFITFWAMELIVMHADGYARNTNNFYVYRDPATGRFEFMPWGIDSILFDDAALPWEEQRPPDLVWAEGALARRLYLHPETQATYLARVQELLDSVWEEGAIQTEIDRMEALIAGSVPAAEQAAFANAVDTVRAFVAGRRATLEGALAGAPPAWTLPLREPWCIDPLGSVSGTFSAQWDSLDGDAFATGDSLIDYELPPQSFPDADGGATAGIDDENAKVSINAVIVTGASEATIFHFELDPSLLAANTTLQLDWTEASGYALKIDFSTTPAGFSVIGLLGEGTLHLDAVGATVSGNFSTTVYESLF